MIRRRLIALALCAAAASASAEEDRFEVVPVPALPGEVPAGTRADQLLWRDARDAMVEGNHQIALANQALYDLKYARLDLAELEKDASGDAAAQLRSLRARLEGPAAALDGVIPRGPLGGCRYTLLHLEQSMGADPGTDLAERLPLKRTEAEKCRDDFRKVIAALTPAVRDLRTALTAVAPELRGRMAARAAKDAPAGAGPSTASVAKP
jgi:hypothetical protein